MQLSPELKQFQQVAREYTQENIEPVANDYDREGKEIPDDMLQDMAELGFGGIILPEKYGGTDAGSLALAVVTEELCRGWLAAGSTVPARNNLIGYIIDQNGTEEQKERYLPDIASGELLLAIAGTEPQAGSDAANIQTRAERDGDGWVLNGTKMFCSFANRADVIAIMARTDAEVEKKHHGISCFLVEKPRDGFDVPGMTADKIDVVGYGGVNTYALYLEDLRVPHDNLVGMEPGQGFYQLMDSYELGRIQVAARALGIARAAFEESLSYAQEREQFGRKIGEFQAIRMKLADMATQIEAARQLIWHAAQIKDAGEPATQAASYAKLFTSEIAEEITSEAIQVHGGYGYAMDFPLQRYWRDAKLMKLGEGTSDIQRRIIAKRLLNE